MPTYYPSRWEDYTVRVINDSLFRQIITIYSFLTNTDVIPYFYSTWLSFTLQVRRHRLGSKKELDYEWRLVESVNNEVVEGKFGKGVIKLHRWWIFKEIKQAIILGRISKQSQYKLQIKVTDEVKPSSYFDVLEFTIKDKDEYGMNVFWVIVSAIIGAIVGGIVGSSV